MRQNPSQTASKAQTVNYAEENRKLRRLLVDAFGQDAALTFPLLMKTTEPRNS